MKDNYVECARHVSLNHSQTNAKCAPLRPSEIYNCATLCQLRASELSTLFCVDEKILINAFSGVNGRANRLTTDSRWPFSLGILHFSPSIIVSQPSVDRSVKNV